MKHGLAVTLEGTSCFWSYHPTTRSRWSLQTEDRKGRKVIEREQKIKALVDELANGDRDIDSHISADTVLFPLISANMEFIVMNSWFHYYIKVATMYISLIDNHLAPR